MAERTPAIATADVVGVKCEAWNPQINVKHKIGECDGFGHRGEEPETMASKRRRLESKREYNRKNAALNRQRTKAHIIDLYTQRSREEAKNNSLTQINADLLKQIEALKRENSALRQRICLDGLATLPTPLLVSNVSSLDSSMALRMGLASPCETQLSSRHSYMLDLCPDRLVTSNRFILIPENSSEAQGQVLQALAMQKGNDLVGWRNSIYERFY